MKNEFRELEELLPGYLSGELSDNERAVIDDWRNESPENEAIYMEYLKAWESIPLLNEMEQFNSFQALKKVNTRVSESGSAKWWISIQRVAAILLVPLMIYSGYITNRNFSKEQAQEENVVMQTISSRQGMVSRFTLADGTKVWLNSCSELQFPTRFAGNMREVNLKGEAFFEVAKNKKLPFRVNAKDLNIDVLGTSFNVVSYEDEAQSEVTLIEGKVSLSAENKLVKNEFGTMQPGQRSVYREESQKVYTEEVKVDKYIAWLDGNLIFRDDNMEDVVKRLSRWFNVEMVIKDPEIRSYAYKATFRNENLSQVMNLLKISAPIDFKIVESKALPNGEFTKQKVYLMKKKI